MPVELGSLNGGHDDGDPLPGEQPAKSLRPVAPGLSCCSSKLSMGNAGSPR